MGGTTSCPLTECKSETPSCVNLDVDPNNCGACGEKCAPGQSCQNGQCELNCVTGFSACNSICTQTSSDPKNCSVCGFSCEPGQVCVNGACALPPPLRVQQAQQNTCEVPCAAGQTCIDGLCITSCALPLTLCGGDQCVDFSNDRLNCGSCGAACNDGFVCSNSTCVAACESGLQACPGNNWCVNVQSSASNCGECGRACQPGQPCVNGICGSECLGPSIMCNQSCTTASSGNAVVTTLHQFAADECIGVVGVSGVYNNTFIVTVQPFNDDNNEVYQMYRMSVDGATITPIGSKIRGNQDGGRADAQFNNPRSLALDPATGNVYVADMKNRAIRVVDVNNNVSTVSQESDGLANPYGIAFFNGDVFVLDTGYNQLFKIELSKGDPKAKPFGQFSSEEAPYVVGVDKNGFVYVTLLGDKFLNVMKFAPDGTRLGLLTTFSASILPTALVVDALLNVYVADGNAPGTGGIYMVSQPSQTVTLVAGGRSSGSLDGVGPAAQFDRPWGLAFAPNNALLVADWMNNSVRKIEQCGIPSGAECPENTCGCANTLTDDKNCGECGNSCPVGQGCINGECTAKTLKCLSVYVDPLTDARNCGVCGNSCPMGQGCVNGACTTKTLKCLGVYVDPLTDAENCGTCGAACTASQTCSNGGCVCKNSRFVDQACSVCDFRFSGPECATCATGFTGENCGSYNGKTVIAVGTVVPKLENPRQANWSDSKTIIAKSIDNGKTWSVVHTIKNQNFWLQSVLWTGKMWLALGSPGLLFSKDDGQTWALLNTNSKRDRRGTAIGRGPNNTFRMISNGYNGLEYTSDDVVNEKNVLNWTKLRITSAKDGTTSENRGGTGIAYGNNIWIALLFPGPNNADPVMARSVDGGETWAEVINPAFPRSGFLSVAFDGKMFITTPNSWDYVMTSSDGLTWTKTVSNFKSFYGYALGCDTATGKTIVTGMSDRSPLSGTTYISTDAAHAVWSLASLNTKAEFKGNGVVYIGENNWVVVGGQKYDPTATTSTSLMYSEDGGNTFSPSKGLDDDQYFFYSAGVKRLSIL